jgi:hypothetical protein
MSTIIQPAVNTVATPTYYPTVEQMRTYMAGVAGQAALDGNVKAYQEYLGLGSTKTHFGTWLVAYTQGAAQEPPPQPPVQFVAQMAEDGVSFDLIPDPAGKLVGVVPSYPKQQTPVQYPPGTGTNPWAQNTSRALMFAAVGGKATQADGTVWVRIS